MQPWRWNSIHNQHDDHVKEPDACLGRCAAILHGVPQQTTISLLAQLNLPSPLSQLCPSRPHSGIAIIVNPKEKTFICTYWINNIAYTNVRAEDIRGSINYLGQNKICSKCHF